MMLLLLLPLLLLLLLLPLPLLLIRVPLMMPPLTAAQARHVQTINEKKQAMNANLTKTQVKPHASSSAALCCLCLSF